MTRLPVDSSLDALKARSEKTRRVVLWILLLAVALLLSFCVLGVVTWIWYVEEPREFWIPWAARVLDSGDTHGGFLGDGVYHLVLQFPSAEQVEALREHTSWPDCQWQRGPVPKEISFYFREHFAQFPPPLDSPNIWFLAQDYKLSTLSPYYNGRFLLLDTETRRAWYSQWDF